MMGRNQETRLWLGVAIFVVCLFGTLLYLLVANKPPKGEGLPAPSDCWQDQDCADHAKNPLQDPDSPPPIDHKVQRPLARIGDEVITYEDFEQYIADGYGHGVLKQMLDGLVIEKEAERVGIKVSEQAMSQELQRMQQGYGSLETFYEIMEEQVGMSRVEIHQDIYHRLMLEQIAIQDIIVTDKELEQYLTEHPEELWSGITLQLRVLITTSERDAEEALNQLYEGVPFQHLAAAYASFIEEDEWLHGDLGWIEADDPFVPDELMQFARSAHVGEISAPIELSTDRYAIGVLQGRKSPNAEEQKRLKEQIRIELSLGKAMPLQTVLQELRKAWDVSILDPEFRR